MADYDPQPGRAEYETLPLAQRDADEIDLQAGLRGVAGLVADARGVNELLGEVAAFATHAIPGVDGASVALLSPPHVEQKIRTCAATDEFVSRIDVIQYDDLHEGPCITCMQTGRAIVSGSLGSDSRWPRFGGKVARMGVHSALSLPLVVGGEVLGAINAYARTRDAFGDHAVALGSQFSGPAAVSVHNAEVLASTRERTEHLQRALTNRAVIDQAIGIIRSRTGASAEEGIERLRQMSQAENVKLALLATQLVDEAVRRAKARHRP
ncbi:MAG: GAF and ANTAR domain-containing protein [Actinomycetia bacterium]|nr:GAF and ANTAR domain-containing protein [Actinomycetes bacterium]